MLYNEGQRSLFQSRPERDDPGHHHTGRKRAICPGAVSGDVNGEETTATPTDAHATAAEAFAERAREELADALRHLYVFGSTVRGDADGLSSDVDVLVVLADDADHEAADETLHDLAYDVMLEHGPVVELHVFTVSTFERASDENPFVRRAVSEGRSYA